MALTETQTSYDVVPSLYNSGADITPLRGKMVQGYANGTAGTESTSLAPITALSGTTGREFHLMYARVKLDIVTSTALYSMVLAGNTIAAFSNITIPTTGNYATSTARRDGIYEFSYPENAHPVVDVASGLTSTTETLILHMSCATKTACSGEIFVAGYYV